MLISANQVQLGQNYAGLTGQSIFLAAMVGGWIWGHSVMDDNIGVD